MNSVLKKYLISICLAVFMATVFRSFIMEAYRVPTEIMKPTLRAGDIILVSKWGYFSDPKPEYGDVLIYTSTQDQVERIKRVIALPGDKIEAKKGHLILNEKEIPLAFSKTEVCGSESHPQSKIAYQICTEPPLLQDFGPRTISKSEIFLMADLRTQNASPYPWEVIQKNQIKGKAKWVWLSVVPESSDLLIPMMRMDRLGQRIE